MRHPHAEFSGRPNRASVATSRPRICVTVAPRDSGFAPSSRKNGLEQSHRIQRIQRIHRIGGRARDANPLSHAPETRMTLVAQGKLPQIIVPNVPECARMCANVRIARCRMCVTHECSGSAYNPVMRAAALHCNTRYLFCPHTCPGRHSLRAQREGSRLTLSSQRGRRSAQRPPSLPQRV